MNSNIDFFHIQEAGSYPDFGNWVPKIGNCKILCKNLGVLRGNFIGIGCS